MRGCSACALLQRAACAAGLVSGPCVCAWRAWRADVPRRAAPRQVYVDQVAAAKEAVRCAARRPPRSVERLALRFRRQRSPGAPRDPRPALTRSAPRGRRRRRLPAAQARKTQRTRPASSARGARTLPLRSRSSLRDRRRDAPEEEAGPATLPLARVKRIIRLDPDVKQTQLDAVRLISRATVRARTAADWLMSACRVGATVAARVARVTAPQLGRKADAAARRVRRSFLWSRWRRGRTA
jgi:hypothetical protein